jgi:phosphate transport system permease protein
MDEKVKNSGMPKRDEFAAILKRRQNVGKVWEVFFLFSNVFALLVLFVLLLTILNGVFGLIAIQYDTEPTELSERPLAELNEEELVTLLTNKATDDTRFTNRLKVLLRDTLSQVATDQFTKAPMSEVLAGKVVDPAIAEKVVGDLTAVEIGKILSDNLSTGQLLESIEAQIIKPQIVSSWTFLQSVTNRAEIDQIMQDTYPEANLQWHSWISLDFLTSPLSTDPSLAGLRTAIVGTLLVITVTILFAFPLGLGAAVYLQEYASDNWINKIIETNIRNLAGVPSIIYGMLGLAVFVRVLEPLTSGSMFGVQGVNGRTVLAGGLTLGLVILPVIIINAQEAIKAVAPSMREASYGLGATKWQTVSRVVVPQAAPGILTGIILGVARAIGETAPLIVVMGAVTFLSQDPSGPFSRFTVIPFQIYQWASRPEEEFQALASAAILTLLVILLIINSFAIYLRFRTSKRV